MITTFVLLQTALFIFRQLTYRHSDRPTCRLAVRPPSRLTDRPTSRHSDRPTNCLAVRPPCRLTDRLASRLPDRPTNPLTDRRVEDSESSSSCTRKPSSVKSVVTAL